MYRIETAHGGKLEGGHLLGFSEGRDSIDACDEFVCAETGRDAIADAYQALGITNDDLIAFDLDSPAP